jgi:flagellar M-ring protein FliF
MNEFLKRMWTNITNLWGKWSLVQKAVLVGIVVAAIAGIIALLGVSSSPNLVPVISVPIRDEGARDQIVMRLDQEGVTSIVSPTGLIQVTDETTARRMRAILVREDLIPNGINPWEIFDRPSWTKTDQDRNVGIQRAIRQMTIDHIKALEEVDDANVILTFPPRELFTSQQNPVKASVIITPRPGSDIARPEGRKKIEGIQKLLKSAVDGLQDENITITDQYSNVLNDFTGMAEMDRLAIIEKEAKHIQKLEKEYGEKMLNLLQGTFSADRVRAVSVSFVKDMSRESFEEKEIKPILIKQQTPGLAYDDSVRVLYANRSQSTSKTTWRGTGFNPEGPTGVEGQTPPAFKDMSNLFGEMSQETDVENREFNETNTWGEKSPMIDRLTVAVNIDGTWNWKYDDNGKPIILPNGKIDREYIPIPLEQMRDAIQLVQGAIGYNAGREDLVIVRNIPFDRTQQFKDEDEAHIKKKQMQLTVIIILSGLTLLLVAFIIFRVIAREMERRRRLAEEERARREQALRESAMMEAEQEGMEVSISMEERARMELMESVVNLTKEHPEDCAQLIRTWLLEE